MFDLTDKKALVTGASRGIGRGIALCLANQGADVAVNYYSKAEEAEGVVGELKSMGRDAFSVQADVSNSESVAGMFATIKEKWGKLDILVNNAGIISYSDFEAITDEQWDQIIGTNLKGEFLCAREAVKLMGNGSRIINIASISSGGAGVGFPKLAHYTASKGGVIGMTENMALELGKRGITVNAIAPGAIDTDMSKVTTTDKNALTNLLMRVPVGRIGKPEDIGAAAAFLASDEASYVNGVTLYVDGGWLTS